MVSWLFWRPSWGLSISVEQANVDKAKKISVSSFLFLLLTNQSLNIFLQSKISLKTFFLVSIRLLLIAHLKIKLDLVS
jgi:hypothetical protein